MAKNGGLTLYYLLQWLSHAAEKASYKTKLTGITVMCSVLVKIPLLIKYFQSVYKNVQVRRLTPYGFSQRLRNISYGPSAGHSNYVI